MFTPAIRMFTSEQVSPGHILNGIFHLAVRLTGCGILYPYSMAYKLIHRYVLVQHLYFYALGPILHTDFAHQFVIIFTGHCVDAIHPVAAKDAIIATTSSAISTVPMLCLLLIPGSSYLFLFP